MRIALATQIDATEFARDDDAYVSALEGLGAEVTLAPWDDDEVDWRRFDAVQIRTTWNYCEQLSRFESWCRQVSEVTRLFNRQELIRWNADKVYLRELERAGMPIVPTAWIPPGEATDIPTALATWEATRGFLKPSVGANASGTLRFDTLADNGWAARVGAHLDAHGRSVTMMLQPYLDTVEQQGELSLIYFDGRFSHAVRKVPRPGDYRVQDDHGASDHPEDPNAAQARLGERCLEIVGGLPFMDRPPLHARVDLMLAPDGQDWVGEVELIEPSLFFRHDSRAAERLARALARRL